jgi:hypothetical protein
MSEPVFRGTCVCGGVRYAISPPFLAFQYCHCSRCRKASGAAHAANLFVPVDQLQWEAGEELVRRYELPEAKYWSHCFCDTCGSAVPWKSRTGRAYIVPAGTLDDDPGIRPTRNIYWASRAQWYLHASELEMFEEGPPKG